MLYLQQIQETVREVVPLAVNPLEYHRQRNEACLLLVHLIEYLQEEGDVLRLEIESLDHLLYVQVLLRQYHSTTHAALTSQAMQVRAR